MTQLLLCGNPNSGKSTLFNRLCGARRRTGNFAGVTVDAGSGSFVRENRSYTVLDLPGLYTLTAHGAEEKIAADALLRAEGVIVNIIDAAALERSLWLTAELAALHRPMVLALNMMDELEARGIRLDIEAIARLTGIPTVPVSARRGEGLDTLIATVGTAPCAKGSFDVRAVAAAAITAKHGDSRDDRIDRIVLRPYIGLPAAALLIAAILFLAFGSVGASLKAGMDALLATCIRAPVTKFCTAFAVHPLLTAFLLDGVLAGVLGVLGFLPQIALLFLCLAVLEDSGLMARMAFLCDPFFARLGLSGRAFFPLCISFGCTVPAVMAARIAPPRERRILYFCLPFVCCPARAPVCALIAAALFPAAGALPLLCLYALGVAAALAAAAVLSHIRGGRSDVFAMELPPYRLPSARTLLLSVWDKCRDFLFRAGTLIFLASSIVWLLQNLGPRGFAETAEESLLYRIGSFCAKPLSPLGFGSATAASALLIGFFAKETILAAFGVLAGGIPLTDALRALFTPASAAAFLVFSLLYTPCIATVSMLRRECGARQTLAIAGFDLAVAYAAAWLTFHAASAFVI